MEKLTAVSKLLIAGILAVCGAVGYRTHEHRFLAVEADAIVAQLGNLARALELEGDALGRAAAR